VKQWWYENNIGYKALWFNAKNLGYSLTEVVNANSEAILYVLDKKGLSGIVDVVMNPLVKELSKRLRNNQ